MAALPTIPETIVLADLSVGIDANMQSTQALFNNSVLPPVAPMTIAIVTDALRWAYDGGAQTPTVLINMRDYLLWLISYFKFQALALQGSGGGGSVVPSGSVRPQPLDFQVSASSTIPTGSNSLTITNFIGYNVVFSRGGIDQNTTNIGDGSSYFAYNRLTGLFSISPAAGLGELFRIVPT